MTGCHIEQKNQPGNWIMGQNTPQAMGKDVLGTFMAHPGVIPGPGGFKRRLILGPKTAIMEEKIDMETGSAKEMEVMRMVMMKVF